jgi:hypothetical protein
MTGRAEYVGIAVIALLAGMLARGITPSIRWIGPDLHLPPG